MNSPKYSIDAPDQPRLKTARAEIEAVLEKHDLAGVVVLHTPGMAEFFYRITPSYSICWIDEAAQAVRLKSNRERDHGGDTEEQLRMQASTANMTASLAGELGQAALMFLQIDGIVSKALGAQHSQPKYVPDPGEEKPKADL